MKNTLRLKLCFFLLLFILPITGSLSISAQSVIITGTVKDADTDEALIGATIIVKGTTKGVICDAMGRYEIALNPGEEILVFSYIGFISQEQQIDNRRIIDVFLKPKAEDISEVVIIGYGTQKKDDLTSSITVVNTEDLARSSATSISKALQGKAAGVYVKQTGGSPGSNASIRIRGIGSINMNPDPLIIIDGIPGGNLNSIDPDDIESMQILKDASAASIYGSRGANGVILVQTKRGRSGKNEVFFNSQFRRTSMPGRLDLMDAEAYKQMLDLSYANTPELTKPAAYSDSAVARNSANTDWQDAMMHPAWEQNYHIRVTGGNEKSAYSISGNYFTGVGNILESNYDRYVFRVSTDFNITDRLKIGESAYVEYVSRSGSGGSFGDAFAPSPFMKVYEPLASEGLGFAGPTDTITGNNDKTNPVAESRLAQTASNNINIFGSLYAEYKIFENLKYRTNVGIEKGSNYNSAFTPEYVLGNIGNRRNPISERTNSTGQNSMWLVDNLLTYNLSLAGHSMEALAGYSAQSWHNEGFNAAGSGFAFPEVNVLSQAEIFKEMGGNTSDHKILSQFFRIIYDYNSKYLFTATMRRDGSSRFGDANKFGYFPSFSIGWKINEDFLQNVEQIDLLKLRLGYGETGNEGIGDYQYINSMDPPKNSQYVFGVDQLTHYGNIIYASFANPQIKWESTQTSNIGLELNAFNNKIQLTTEYYYRKQHDMLVRRPVAVALGRHTSVARPWVNLGSVTNKGFEAGLIYKNTIGDFQYQFSGTFTTIKNEVVKLADDKPITDTYTITIPGHSIGSFYGHIAEGILQNSDFVQDEEGNLVLDTKGNYVITSAFQELETAPGDIKFKDLNNDGLINDLDRTIIGKPIPDFIYGLNFEVSYKSLSFYIFLNGMQNVDVYNNLYSSIGLGTDASNRDINKLNSVLDNCWSEDIPCNTNTRLSPVDVNNNDRISSWFVEDASFLRIQDIQISYSIDPKLLEKYNLRELDLFAGISNPGFIFNNYSGLDPEAGGSSPLSSNIDNGGYPIAKTLLVGLKVKF